jgi:hypothetical protein
MAYQPTNYDPANYIPASYQPGDEASGSFGLSSADWEVDIRLYSSAGLRMYLPSFWIDALDFEYSERGGYGNGRLGILAGWDDLTFDGTEYVDVRLFGEFAYRGYALQPEQNVDSPERWNLGLFGLMERLNGFLVRRCNCYAEAVDVSTIFSDLITTYVQVANRLPNVVYEASGVPALGITTANFCAKGKTIPQALNDLCDLAPDLLIWGCDVDAEGNDRIYLRPKPTETAYTAVVGDKVRAFVYPRDATQVVNTVYVEGGEADPKNLITNGSFEECSKPGELEGNLLLNPSFEENAGGSSATSWGVGFNPTISETARTGSSSFYMDNNPGGPEEISQIVSIGELNGISASVWLMNSEGANNIVRLSILLLDAGNAILGGLQGPNITPPDDGLWHRYSLEWADVQNTDYPGVVSAQWVITCLACTDDALGVHVDDAALWIPTVGAKGWAVGTPSTAHFLDLEWNDTASPAAADGSVKVRVQADISGGGYVEIVQAEADRPDVNGGRLYYVDFRVRPSGGAGVVVVGAYEYDGGTLTDTHVGSDETLVNNLWQQVSISFTTSGNATKVAPFIRFKTDERVYYVDGAGLWESSLPSRYYPGDRFEAEVRTSDYSSAELGAAAFASITTWGVREAEESIESVVDEASLQVWAIAYFRKWAIPQVNGRLEIFGAEELLTLAGRVALQNLPSAPSPLFPARIRYTVGESINITADLNEERPTQATLLRQIQRE